MPTYLKAVYFALAVIVIGAGGGFIITLDGIIPIVTNPALRAVIGSLAIALGVAGVLGLRGRFRPPEQHG